MFTHSTPLSTPSIPKSGLSTASVASHYRSLSSGACSSSRPMWQMACSIHIAGFRYAEKAALHTIFRLTQRRPIQFSTYEFDCPFPDVVLVEGSGVSHQDLYIVHEWATQGSAVIAIGIEPAVAHWQCFSQPLPWGRLLQLLEDTAIWVQKNRISS